MTQQQRLSARSSGLLARLARGALWLLFASILFVPRLLALRRRRAWNIVRAILATVGVVLILTNLTGRAGTAAAVLGTALTLAGLLVPPERARQSLDDRARQLGALIAVNGGICRPASGDSFKAHLCVSAERVWLLDSALAVRIELPFASLAEVRARPGENNWNVSLHSRGLPVELFYTGPFAEHFARVAESTVRSQLHRELLILR